MKKRIIVLMVCASALASCGLYSKYERPDVDVAFDETIELPGWMEMYTDPKLRVLIEKALSEATSPAIAALKVEEAEAALQKARGQFLPSLDGSGSADLRYGDLGAGLRASWQLDIFGKVRNAAMASRAALEESEAYRQAVTAALVSAVAQSYYTLLVLDSQLDISLKTLDNWDKTISVLESMKAAGKTNSISILQAKATRMRLESSTIGIKGSIEMEENSLKALVGDRGMTIERGSLDEASFPIEAFLEIPLRAVASRPDIRQAEMALAEAFYNTAKARSAFYPDITLTGNSAWRSGVDDIAWSALGDLAEPILDRNARKADLKAAKARQEEARLVFRQALLDAGAEVDNAISKCRVAAEKMRMDSLQREALSEAMEKIQLTMIYSSTNYLEVLTAQQSLLDAELGIISDKQSITSALIALYQALGGGVN
ncbi:MAG: TolC family protein [Bacteroidales bacterium]|nr:TolC family protein [Bacteroidales bacterium]